MLEENYPLVMAKKEFEKFRGRTSLTALSATFGLSGIQCKERKQQFLNRILVYSKRL